MGLRYENLDADTRSYMVKEIESDIAGRGLYESNYLNGSGVTAWPRLLREAANSGTDDSLASELRSGQMFKIEVERRKPKGGTTMAAVPHTAAETLSESQFNMYYMRALSLIAIRDKKSLVVYRAKVVANPRSESELMIGTSLDPTIVVAELRKTKGVETSIGIPMPNSGLCVRLA